MMPVETFGNYTGSPNLTFSHVVITGDAKSHLHKEMEEIYYVTKGEGELIIGERC